MLERWRPALLALALVQLILGGIAAVTVGAHTAVPFEGERGLPPAMTVPFPPEAPNPATPVQPPAGPPGPPDPVTGAPGGGGAPSPALPSSVMGDWSDSRKSVQVL